MGYNLIFGFSMTGIDNAAHLGGLATGFIVGAALIRPLPLLKISSRLANYVALGGVVLVLALGAGLVKKPASARAIDHFNQGVNYQEQGKMPQAIQEYDQAIKLAPNLSEAFANRGIAYAMLGRYPQALQDFNAALEGLPDDASLHYLRGRVYAETGQREPAIADLEKALELGLEPDVEQDAIYFLEQLSP